MAIVLNRMHASRASAMMIIAIVSADAHSIIMHPVHDVSLLTCRMIGTVRLRWADSRDRAAPDENNRYLPVYARTRAIALSRAHECAQVCSTQSVSYRNAQFTQAKYSDSPVSEQPPLMQLQLWARPHCRFPLGRPHCGTSCGAPV